MEHIIKGFREQHKKKGTKIIHLIALIIITYGYLSLIYNNKLYLPIVFIILIIYSLLSVKITLIYFFIIILINFIIKNNGVKSYKILISLIIFGYLLTNMSHYIFNEPTYNSKYKNNNNFMKIKIIHNLYLPLFILDSLFYKKVLFMSGKINIDEKFKTYTLNYINNKIINNNNHVINKYIVNTNYKLNKNTKNKIQNIINTFIKNNNLINYNFQIINDINEIYITKNNKNKNNNITVEKEHIDGHIPNIFNIKTFRLLIQINKDKNDKSFTFFKNQSNYKNNNFWIFDYNKQIHKAILNNNNITEPRVLLKIHFIIYPDTTTTNILNLYKKLLIFTNKNMRNFQNNSNLNIIPFFHLKNFLLKPLNL